MKMMDLKLIYVRLDLLDATVSQPKKRADAARIKELKRIIEITGIILPLIVTRNGARYTVHDGNRRWAVAVDLGCTEVQVIVLENLTAEAEAAMFFIANCYTAPVSGSQRLEGYASTPKVYQEGVLLTMRTPQAKQITDLIEMIGEVAFKRLADKGTPLASAALCVRKVRSWCLGYALDCPTPKAIVLWCAEHKTFRLLDTISRHPTAKAVEGVVNAIREKRDYAGPRK